MNTDFDSLLKQTEFVVEADGFAALELWEKYANNALQRTKIGEWVCYNDVEWKEMNPGCVRTIGYYNEEPVNLSLRWQRLNGHLVMFWEAISRIVDHQMIEKWLSDNCCSNRCNAMNFHLVYHYVRGQ